MHHSPFSASPPRFPCTHAGQMLFVLDSHINYLQQNPCNYYQYNCAAHHVSTAIRVLSNVVAPAQTRLLLQHGVYSTARQRRVVCGNTLACVCRCGVVGVVCVRACSVFVCVCVFASARVRAPQGPELVQVFCLLQTFDLNHRRNTSVCSCSTWCAKQVRKYTRACVV